MTFNEGDVRANFHGPSKRIGFSAFRHLAPAAAALRIGSRSQIARKRADFDRFSEKSENRWTGWWIAESDSNYSLQGISLINWEKTGNFRILGIRSVHSARKRRVIAGIFQRIPCRSEQGIREADQGIIIP